MQSFFPTVPQKVQANQSKIAFANGLHTIYRMWHEEIERPRVTKWRWKAKHQLQVQLHKHEKWLGWPFAFLCHLYNWPYGVKIFIKPSRSSSCVSRYFPGELWRPSRCPNWVKDSSFERYLSLIFLHTGLFWFGVHFPFQKSNLPSLVELCQMRLPEGRVLLRSTFEYLPQL